MKIRLVSIEGTLGDFQFNFNKTKEEIDKGIKDKIDILVIPVNSISSDSLLDDEMANEDFQSFKSKYEGELEEYIKEKSKEIKIWHRPGLYSFESYTFEIDNGSKIENLESLSNAIEKNKLYSPNIDFKIICRGNGTESVVKYIYSNLKMIYFKNELLCSNLKSFENTLDYEFDETHTENNLEKYTKTPYLDKIIDKNEMFKNILYLQGVGLYHKLKSMNREKICLGISGGLDSTVSLLACVEIFKKYNLPLKNIIGVTMPGLGTTETTYHNAINLMKKLEITIEDIDLRPLLNIHLKNISQPENKFDVTYEQCQSRERTQVLLDIANRENAIMIGTGCMSEFALGWMTYGGDHLSMYAINIGLPKSVVKMYANWFINYYDNDNLLKGIISYILNQPVSPELLPLDDKGIQNEKTESLIGDYLVQDFFIYHTTVNHFSIKKIYTIACSTFPEYNKSDILKWLKIFVIRYYTRAYKKNCYGDGIQLFNYSVSPNYLRVPSDININMLINELNEIG